MQWNPILQSIKDKKCVLFMGPNLLESENADGSFSEIQASIQAHLNEIYPNLYHYEQDELFLFDDESQRNEAYWEIKAFLDKQKIHADFYQKMMAIPFQMCINFSPYLNPVENFPKMDIPYPFDYEFYHKNPNVSTAQKENTRDCWLYDLFGNVNEAESVVLTHNDLFNYVGSILGGKPLPIYFKSKLQEAQYFIFLGFSFEKWYVQLIIRLLRNIRGEKDRTSVWRAVRENAKNPLGNLETHEQFYQKELKVQFISDIQNTQQFINELYTECEKMKILRKLPTAENTQNRLSDQLLELLKQDKIAEVIKQLSDFFQEISDEIYDGLIVLSSRFTRLEKRYSQGILEEKEYNLEINKIILGLQDCIKELKSHE